MIAASDPRAVFLVVAALLAALTGCTSPSPSEDESRTAGHNGDSRGRHDRDRPSPRPEPGRTRGDPVLASVPHESFRFVAIGDFGEGNRDEDRVAEAVHEWVRETDARALVTTGDNIYPAGAPEYFDDAWYDPYGWVEEEGIDVTAALGNHDVEAGQGDTVMDLLDIPRPWYRERIGSADMFVLDANRPTDADQRSWLERALRASDAAWQIAVFHQPAFSCSHHGSTPEVIEQWVPIFEREGVDLVLNGHDHTYQRFLHNGVTYVVTGGGGAELYGLRDCDAGDPDLIVGDDEEHHFVGVYGSQRTLRLVAVEDDGDLIDAVRLTP